MQITSSGRSLMYSRISVRPRMKTWGTYWILLRRVPIKITWSRLLLRKEKRRLNTRSEISQDFSSWRRPESDTLLKALDITSLTARSVPDLLQSWQFYQIQMREDLQLIGKVWNHTGNLKRGHVAWGDQQAY